MPSNVSIVINDQDKQSRTTNNSDVKTVRNEDADCPDRPLDVGDHYVVRRPDGSWRESFVFLVSAYQVRHGCWWGQVGGLILTK
jgi:hypothetical protein